MLRLNTKQPIGQTSATKFKAEFIILAWSSLLLGRPGTTFDLLSIALEINFNWSKSERNLTQAWIKVKINIYAIDYYVYAYINILKMYIFLVSWWSHVSQYN